MADTLFCIEVGREHLSGVLVEESSRVVLVLGHGVVSTEDKTFTEALRQLLEQVGYTGGRSLLAIDPSYFFFRNLTLPFADGKKIAQILPFELTDSSPVGIDTLLIDFQIIRSTSEGSDILAAMISRDLLGEWLSILRQEGINPDHVTISGVATSYNILEVIEDNDFLHLDLHKKHASLFILNSGRLSLVRSIRGEKEPGPKNIGVELLRTLYGFQGSSASSSTDKLYLTGETSLQDAVAELLEKELPSCEIVSFIESQQPLVKISEEVVGNYRPGRMDRVLALAVHGRGTGFDFRKEEFKKTKSRQEYQGYFLKFALPVLALIIGLSLYQAYQYKGLQTRYDELRSEIASVFKNTVPDVTRVVNPVQQLQVINNGIMKTYKAGAQGAGGGYSMIDLLTELSARIPISYKVKIVRLVADLDSVRFKALTSDFNTVDNVQKELEKSVYFSDVDISSANQSPQGDEIRFELKMKLAR
jgi:general secretion pathway protein L